MKKDRLDILITGDINVDITMPVEEYPVPGRGWDSTRNTACRLAVGLLILVLFLFKAGVEDRVDRLCGEG